jgi:soluble P-type ATPase
VAVGDGANDLDMIATAGLGIAFTASPRSGPSRTPTQRARLVREFSGSDCAGNHRHNPNR